MKTVPIYVPNVSLCFFLTLSLTSEHALNDVSLCNCHKQLFEMFSSTFGRLELQWIYLCIDESEN